MAKDKEIRPYSLYATREHMVNQLKNGFTEVAFSYEGDWPKKGFERVVRMCVFYGPQGEALTYEHREIDDISLIRALNPYGCNLKEDGVKARVRRFGMKFGERRKIKEVLDDIIGWEFR